MAKEQKASLEDHFEKIEAILTQLEGGDTSLDESFELYKQGMDEIKQANTMLDGIEKAMLVLNDEGKLEEF